MVTGSIPVYMLQVRETLSLCSEKCPAVLFIAEYEYGYGACRTGSKKRGIYDNKPKTSRAPFNVVIKVTLLINGWQ